MLACMETQLGITIMGPTGNHLRVQRTSPVFASCKKLLSEGLPEQLCWTKLHELVANPLSALLDWCEGFSVRFNDAGNLLCLNDVQLPRKQWLPLFERTMAVAGSPHLILAAAELFSNHLDQMAGATECLQVSERFLKSSSGAVSLLAANVVRVANLPASARAGDQVTGSGGGDFPYLVGYFDFDFKDGVLNPLRGRVLRKLSLDEDLADVLAQPFIQGQNLTYRCEEGTNDGWLEDMSFDSLSNAIFNAKDIQRTGAEARIINLLTGGVVAWP